MASPLKSNAVAAIWGFGEAVFFFVVPDVWLSFVGRRNLRAGLIACGFALLGALIGGGIMYVYGAAHPDSVNTRLTLLPGISQAQVVHIQEEMSKSPYRAMILGPVAGNPFKIYAANFHRYDGSLAAFLLTAVPARIVRFIVVTALVHFAFGGLRRRLSERTCTIILFVGWIAFYIHYFTANGW